MYNLSGKLKKETILLTKAGKTSSEIRSYLSFKGYNEKDIKNAVRYSKNFNILRRYIKSCIYNAHKKEDIMKVLKESKWPLEIIKDVMRDLE